MNKNEKCEERSSDVCEKILRAIHTIALCGQAPNPAHSEATSSLKAPNIQTKPERGLPRTFVLENGVRKSSTSDLGANIPKLESTRVDQESERSGNDIDQRTSDYIKRTWLKIRSMSNLGRAKTHSPTEDTGHDQFADYITRAKKKLRTTLSIGGGGGRSFSSK